MNILRFRVALWQRRRDIFLDINMLYKLLATEIYELLLDSETRLFLETNEYLCEACDKELEKGADALFEFINS